MQVVIDFYRIIISKKDGKQYTIFQLSSPGTSGNGFAGREHLPDFVMQGACTKYEPGEVVEAQTKVVNAGGQLVVRIVGFND